MSENAEVICQIEQDKEELNASQAAVDAYKAVLDERGNEQREKGGRLYNVQNTL